MTVIFEDYTGKKWDLSTGSDGVYLDTGAAGLVAGAASYSYSPSGRVTAVGLGRMEPTLRLRVDDSLPRREWVEKLQSFMGAQSAFADGVLHFIDGRQDRFLNVRLRENPDVSFLYDPLLEGWELPSIPWSLTSRQTGWAETMEELTLKEGRFSYRLKGDQPALLGAKISGVIPQGFRLQGDQEHHPVFDMDLSTQRIPDGAVDFRPASPAPEDGFTGAGAEYGSWGPVFSYRPVSIRGSGFGSARVVMEYFPIFNTPW